MVNSAFLLFLSAPSIHGLSSAIEYVGYTHEKSPKSCVLVPNSSFCYWLLLGVVHLIGRLRFEETRNTGTLRAFVIREKCWLKNGIAVCNQARDSMSKTWQAVGAVHGSFSCCWGPYSFKAFSLQAWHYLRGNKQAFHWYKIYCEEALLQQRNWPNINFIRSLFDDAVMLCFSIA